MAAEQEHNYKGSKRTTFKKKAKSKVGVKNAKTTNYSKTSNPFKRKTKRRNYFNNDVNRDDNKNDDNDNYNNSISPQLLRTATQIKQSLQSQHPSTSRNKYFTLKIIEKGRFDEIRIIRDNKIKKTKYCLKMIKKKGLKYKYKKSSKLTKCEPNWKQIENYIFSLYKTSKNIININEVWIDSEYINIVMALCDTNLSEILLKQEMISQHQLQHYFIEIINGLNEIHKLGLIHRDLTPSHILITRSDHIKISDYGLQRYFYNEIDEIITKYKENADKLILNTDDIYNNDEKKEEKKGDDTMEDTVSWNFNIDWNKNKNNNNNNLKPMSICYVSPEIFTIKGYDEMTDWWSMGVILYECLIGNIPFNAKDPMEICQKIVNYKKWIQIDELINFIVIDMNPSVIDLLSNLITNKRIRYGYPEIIKHSWLKDVSQTISDPIKPENVGFKFDFSSESKTNDFNQDIASKSMSKFNTSTSCNEQQWKFTWNTQKESFRDSINYNKFPSDISSIELFDDYCFDTDSNEQDIENDDDENALFYPSYCYFKSIVPDALLPGIDENDENKEEKNKDEDVEYIFDHYMTVKLKSNITDKDLCRNPLSLVICLDISGSMNTTFDDKFDPYLKYKNQHKIEIAKKCLIGILDHLTEKDSFGLVLFNDEPMIFECLESINNIDMNELKTRISIYIEAAGGTNMESGYNSAISMLLKQNNENNDKEKRIIFLTDSLLNTDHCLLGMMNKYSQINEGNVYSTLIGIGIDFDMDLINKMKIIRGSNCYSIHSEKELIETMDHGFDALINPLLFNLRLKIESTDNSCCIEKIYGVHMDDMDDILKTGEIIKINTLFASKQNDFLSTKEGVILLKLKYNENRVNNKNLNVMKVCVIYEDKNGVIHKNEECVIFDTKRKQNDGMIGIRKSVLLSRYFQLLYEWINHDKHYFDNTYKLKVSPIFLDKFIKFLPYFHSEMNEIKDDKLKKEVNILEKLINVEENDTFQFTNSSPWQWNFTFDGSQKNDIQ